MRPSATIQPTSKRATSGDTKFSDIGTASCSPREEVVKYVKDDLCATAIAPPARVLNSICPPSVSGNLPKARQIDEADGLAVRQIDKLPQLEFRKRSANRLKRRAEVICNIGARNQKAQRAGPISIFRQMLANA